ncbi:class A beta-lactamase-related serine hydrolase [Bailinhaonella thermotolerans]|uniref:Class A beta-lactamase-related serine hydrolase n=2 Tax=Bailinhaonella thermotolerans TaxID=1070861 RepID=A0A3A4AZT4_9ACTN|nr:class A beta-lactamase-related serine hydrolase [Bailinhaonella thermotolerans]
MGAAAVMAGAPAAGARSGPDDGRLRSALEEVHRAGMVGIDAAVRAGGREWRGASGVADLATGRPLRPGTRHRVGSITKTFTAAAILQQVEKGRVRLDAPIGRYLPDVVPGERGRKITVRMLLNHTSGLSEYLLAAFPSLAGFPSLPDMSAKSLDDNRFRRFRPEELIKMGLALPAKEPGSLPGVYSNTNYLILGLLLEKVTGAKAEDYITEHVIRRAGLRHTTLPAGPRIKGPHPRMYEAMHGLLDPPRDYSVYDPSWVGVGASLVSTVEDLNRFYSALLGGRIVSRASLARMQRTVPVSTQVYEDTIEYGLGLRKVTIPGCGTFWGHDGTMWGAGALSLTRADGARQMSQAINLMRWNTLDASGEPRPHPIDKALSAFQRQALCT